MVKKEDVLAISKLAKLFVDESELEDLAKDMQSIINFANEIIKVSESSGIFDSVNDLSNVLREDEVTGSFDRDLILKNANSQKNGFFCLKNYSN